MAKIQPFFTQLRKKTYLCNVKLYQTIRYAENQSYTSTPPMTTSAFRLANEKDPIN
jgi:hypothetical protein